MFDKNEKSILKVGKFDKGLFADQYKKHTVLLSVGERIVGFASRRNGNACHNNF